MSSTQPDTSRRSSPEPESAGLKTNSVPPTSPARIESSSSPPRPGLVNGRADVLRVLEALRLGVVPQSEVREYTVGRDRLFAQITADLKIAQERGNLRIVVGDYGSGKTHLLQWLRHEALRRNFLCAHATLDGRETTPAHPRRIYKSFMYHLSYPDHAEQPTGLGLGPLIDRLAARGVRPKESTDPGYHKYIDPVIHYTRALERDGALDIKARLLDWINGQPTGENTDWNVELRRKVRGPYLYALPDYRTFGHVYGYVLGGIACAAQTAGYAGLVLLIDEAEFYEVLGAESKDFAEEVFRCYALAALGSARVRFRPQDLRKGGHAVHRGIPATYHARQPLYCVFFLTPVAGGMEMLARTVDLAAHRVELAALTAADFRTLLERVQARYVEAHPRGQVSAATTRALRQALTEGAEAGALQNPRAAIRLTLDVLDVARLAPGRLPTLLADIEKALGNGFD